MELTGYLSLLLIVINIIVSYRGFNNRGFFHQYSFGVDKVRLYKDYKVLVTAGFLHVNWLHLIFNMIALYFFGSGIEALGALPFLLIYFISLVCGHLFSLLVHRHQGDYTSVGASGAVCGIIFATIALAPNMRIGFFLLPISIPAWLFGVLFVAYSIWGVRSRRDNVGHDAHLAGALAGMIVAILLYPGTLSQNYLAILAVFVPTAVFILFIVRNPTVLLVSSPFARRHQAHTIDQRYNIDKKQRQEEIDRILEKIHRRGMNSLTQKEKDFLKQNAN
jgi:membrane associated rhomboid family serine protease